jgi:hypothetical protein
MDAYILYKAVVAKVILRKTYHLLRKMRRLPAKAIDTETDGLSVLLVEAFVVNSDDYDLAKGRWVKGRAKKSEHHHERHHGHLRVQIQNHVGLCGLSHL